MTFVVRGIIKLLIKGILVFCLFQTLGCVDNSVYGDSVDRKEDAVNAALLEASEDFNCKAVKAVGEPQEVREGNWQSGLFSEYLILIRGCHHSGEFRVNCRGGHPCAVADE